MTVPLAGGAAGEFTLHIQRLKKDSSSNWTNQVISKFVETDKTPCQTFQEIKVMWQGYYQAMIDAGIHPSVIQLYIDSISNPRNESSRESAGVYAETGLAACGFAGAPGMIICGPYAVTSVQQYYVPHENTHGFQWELTAEDDEQNLLLYRIFGKYANDFYHQSQTDPSHFTPSDRLWYVETADYTLQNEAEWIAQIFPNYLFGGITHWAYIDNNFPQLKAFFNCVWKTGGSFSSCQASSGAPMISYPETVPVVDIPVVAGFTQAETEAIWNTCFRTAASSTHQAAFDTLIERLTPGLYANSSSVYRLGFGDCNHDGVVDWVCSYKGAAPGGGNYLWNSSNQVGAYTFVVSGKDGDTYAEYKQDPYITLSSTVGTIVQPMYREWQGNYGSCNGAFYFRDAPSRYSYFVQGINGLPAELLNKTDW